MSIQRTTPAAFSITSLNSLASHATNGAQSAEVASGTAANVTAITANLAIAMPSLASPSGATKVDVYVWGTNDDAGYPGGSVTNEVITGSAGTIVVSAIANNALKFAGVATLTVASTLHTVKLDIPVHVALGFIPRRWGLVFINNTGAALPASGHVAEYVEEFYN